VNADRDRPGSEALEAEPPPPVRAVAIPLGDDPSGPAMGEDPFTAFTKWGGSADEVDDANL
jgi:hypothetical protein